MNLIMADYANQLLSGPARTQSDYGHAEFMKDFPLPWEAQCSGSVYAARAEFAGRRTK